MLSQLLVVEDGESNDNEAQNTKDCQGAINGSLNVERLSFIILGGELGKDLVCAKC